MKLKDLILTIIVAIAALLVLAGCEDSLGIEDRVIKERLGVDTIIRRDTVIYQDTIKVVITDTILVRKDTTIQHIDTITHRDTIPYYDKKMPEHIRASINYTFREVYSSKTPGDDVFLIWRAFPREILATIDTAYNGMKMNIRFNLENSEPTHLLNNGITVNEIIQSIQVNLRNLNPFYSGPELPCDGDQNGRTGTITMHLLNGTKEDYNGVSTKMRIVFSSQKYDANFKLNSVRAQISAEVQITGTKFTLHKIIGDLVINWQN